MRPLFAQLTLLPVFAAFALPLNADDWPQFLGPNRNGVSTETKLTDTFPSDGAIIVYVVSGRKESIAGRNGRGLR
jgi:hypothetical protein